MTDPLNESIQFIKGVGPKLAKVFEKKGVGTLEDALYFVPRDYEDRSLIQPIQSLRPGTSATLMGKVVSSGKSGKGVKFGRGARRGGRFEVVLEDATGRVTLVWFHAFPGMAEEFAIGEKFVVYGEVKFFGGMLQIAHPEYEKVVIGESGRPIKSLNFGRVVPVYSETEGLHQKTIRRIIGQAIKVSLDYLDEPFPDTMLQRLEFPTLRKSFVSLHFPEIVPAAGTLNPALRRIIFEEFFVLQLGLLMRKEKRKIEEAPALKEGDDKVRAFIDALPFPLTGDQTKVIGEISGDIATSKMMTRLVQGDVGAGKTVVGLAAAIKAAANGYQTAFMAPTEVLAQQHFRTACQLALTLKPSLLTQETSKNRSKHSDVITTEESLLVIGTHALFQESVCFEKLGLVIVDEQHRFGVEQRSELLKKGGAGNPHLLMMTATPIPRTLALTLYGDLDVSLLREKPPGRKPVRTRIYREPDRGRLYAEMRDAIKNGNQIYVIYPLVEASEKLDLKSATDMYETLRKNVFPDFRVALVHGRMKSDEKDKILADFKAAKYDILVSTTVIEVGIDVPNATLMVIEHPERLGLSQLHQLRGRVGRGSAESRCILMADKFVTERLRIMEMTDDGFEIAEEDLKIRGPGEFLGTRQSGLPGFRVGHVLRDVELLTQARNEAVKLLESDPNLELPENRGIRKMVASRWKVKMERLHGG